MFLKQKIISFLKERLPVFWNVIFNARMWQKYHHIAVQDLNSRGFSRIEIKRIIEDFHYYYSSKLISWNEYFYQYKFQNMQEPEKEGFITRRRMQIFYNKIQKKQKVHI